jgi:hypothetical protein
LCASMSVVEYRGPKPIPDQTVEFPGATPEEYTLPDYAGQESPSSDVLWKRPVDSATPENNVDIERTETEIAEADKPEPVDISQMSELEKLESLERLEQVQLAEDAALEMARQSNEAELPMPQVADAPDVNTAESAAPSLEVQVDDVERMSPELSADRVDPEIVSAVQELEKTQLQVARNEATLRPEDVLGDMAARSDAKPVGAGTAKDDVQVITRDAQEMVAREQPLETVRQRSSSTPGSNRNLTTADSPESLASPAIERVQPNRASGASNPAPAVSTSIGAEAIGRNSSNVSAADSNAENVQVTSSSGAAAAVMTESTAASSGPRGSAAAVPAGSNSDGTSSAAIAESSNGGGRISAARVARSSTGSDLPAISGASGSQTLSRSSVTNVGLPVGAAEAEESGTLVFAGPQASETGRAMAGSSLPGPRISSVPRRSAGLPGSRGPATAARGALGENIIQPARVGLTSPGTGNGQAKPKLTMTDSVAGMIRKSRPGIGGSAEARIAENLSMRTSEARREAAKLQGGSAESENAVERGLAWLARNQYPDGHWSIDDFPGEPDADTVQGSFRADSAATGLALLAYLGAGYTHQAGKYQDVVSRGVQWLLKRQKPDGDLFAEESDFVQFYSHGMASIALCEVYGLTRDSALKAPAQNALSFIVASQHPEFGGWRYRARFESDTSVSGWQLMALKSGEMAGLTVPKDAYARIGKWLDSVQSKTLTGQFSYHPTREPSPAMTAEALLMRQYLGAKRDDAQLVAGADFLRTRLPDSGQRDSYYWYYATQVMFHMQGENWNAWNTSLRDSLVETQSKEGTASGSWDPLRPTPEKWSSAGGQHYLTCLNLLMLEVYYRHLPLYLELEK